MADDGRLSGPPFVLLGAPRSGTTYLQHLVDADPRVVLTNESRLFTWVHRAWREACDSDKASARQRAAFLDHLRTSLPALLRDFYRGLDGAAVHWGDKNPFYSLEDGVLGTIEELFPRTRYVHLVRDGRDVVTSLHRRRRADGTPWADFAGGHRVWLLSLAACRDLADQAGDRYLQLRYEDLVADDEEQVTRVFAHLGLTPDDAVLAYARRQASERTPLSRPTRELDDPAASAWEEAWSPAERLTSLEELGDDLVALGYETAESLAALRQRTAAEADAAR